MNTMSITIRRLLNTFLALFLVISLIAAYTQIANQAFFNGPALAHSAHDPRKCPPFDAAVRGTIYDRNGVKLAWSEPDPNATCGYRRVYADPSLAPLIGYYSPIYGTAGLENTFDAELSGVQQGGTLQDVTGQETNTVLHRPRYGQDIYLTIDENLQKAANSYYDSQARTNPPISVCQPAGSHPAGSIIVEDPKTGEILAMVSRPYYDPNKIDDPAYWQQIQSETGVFLNHATQGVYAPGSTFKTITLIAALDSGAASLSTPFSYDQATHFKVNGQDVSWVDYLQNGDWKNATFPMTLEQAYAYSDNVIYARMATQLGADKWLSYLRKFGIAVPGSDVTPPPFDAPFTQSSAYPANTGGQPTNFDANLLAASGYGQGDLLISPLTMAEVTSAVADDGVLMVPHSTLAVVPHATSLTNAIVQQGQVYTGQPLFSPQTAQNVRKAMADVATYGTGFALNGSDVHMGGKTGTAQLSSGLAHAWWISLAPDDAFGTGPAKLVTTVMKENSGEGACQVFVAEKTYQYAIDHQIGPYKTNG